MPMVHDGVGVSPLMGRGEDFGVSHTTANIQRDHATKRNTATSSGHLTFPKGVNKKP